MKYEEITIALKNGQNCLLRSPTAEDAEAMLQYFRQTCGETEFMGRYEDEIIMKVEDEQNLLDEIINDPKRAMIAAFIDNKLVANIGFSWIEPFERFRHRAGFGMSILKDFWGLGIGSALMEALIEAARKAEYEQLELEVVAENERAIALYKKFGFEIFGTRENTLKYRDGHYCAAHLMMKKL